MSLDKSGPQPASFWCRTLGALTLHPDPADPRPLMEAGKPLAVLVYLALAPGGKAKRDHVAELLWPGSEIPEARHSLRQSLYRLRHATGGVPLVHLRGTELELQEAARFDCLEGERMSGDGELPRAYELLRGSFLEGFSIPESCEFESWAEAQRIRFRRVRHRRDRCDSRQGAHHEAALHLGNLGPQGIRPAGPGLERVNGSRLLRPAKS